MGDGQLRHTVGEWAAHLDGSAGPERVQPGTVRPSGGRARVRPALVHDAVTDQARRTPDAVALVDDRGQISYAELEQRTDRLAWRLQQQGAGPEAVVGICLERGIDLVVAMLGVLKSGAAYLPLDPSFPAERLRFMVCDASAAIVLTDAGRPDVFDDCGARRVTMAEASATGWQPTAPPRRRATPANAAYIIYTSGSTGVPKGVVIEHRNLASFLDAMDDVLGTRPGVWLAVTSISFDISVLELLWTLSCGFRVVIQGERDRLAARSDRSIAGSIARHGVTHLQCTPSMCRLILAADEGRQALGSVRTLMLGGEALPGSLVKQLRDVTQAEIFNFYGPTETTVWSTACRIPPDGAVSIGRPLANTVVYVVDPSGARVPDGHEGEVWIGGAGVARGYLNRPELTADRFVPDPFSPGRRVYRTGDWVRRRADGDLEFLGRIDNQVKVLGFRIEPEEIEVRLADHPAVAAAVVVPVRRDDGDVTLTACVVPRSRELEWANLRAFLEERLPAHMVPVSFIEIPEVPHTPNGKTDRAALRALAEGRPGVCPQPPIGESALEEVVAALWREALGVDVLGVTVNFFDAGATSLMVAEVASRLRRQLGAEIALTDVFRYPTVRSLARFLSGEAADDGLAAARRRGRSRREALAARAAVRPH